MEEATETRAIRLRSGTITAILIIGDTITTGEEETDLLRLLLISTKHRCRNPPLEEVTKEAAAEAHLPVPQLEEELLDQDSSIHRKRSETIN